MNCLSKEQLVDYIFSGDGPLRASMEAHVSACPGCRARIESLERLRAAAASAPLTPVSGDFTARLMRSLPAGTPRRGYLREFYGYLFRPAWALGLAACAVILYFGAVALKGPGLAKADTAEVLYFSDGPATVRSGLSAPAGTAVHKQGVYSYTDSCATARCGML
ncbi:MAG: hypothetical protein M0011_02560 [Elusimicrobia bacterium]|nr:hypothetical protein [Elusimicrobiota bacterium]